MTRSTANQEFGAPPAWRSVGLVLAVLALVVLPGIAEACAVCFQAKTDASRIAFIATTAFMTALPLVLFGSVVYWLRRRFAAAEPAIAVESESEMLPDPLPARAAQSH